MDKESLLRLVDSLHRDKEIAKDVVFQGIEAALTTAARKHFKSPEAISIQIDRHTGEIVAMDVNLGKTEGVLHKSEQIADEHYNTGERIRATVFDVKKVGTRVRIMLSRAHTDFVRRLFELEVPEIAEGTIEIKALAREPGHRTKIAVTSSDLNVDCVGACVGVRGSRIKNIVDELNGEKIEIIRWSDEPETLLPNALKPAEVSGIILSSENQVATIVVPNDQLSLAIGKRGQNVRLASRLTAWDIDIITESELEERQKASVLETTEVAGSNKAPSDNLNGTPPDAGTTEGVKTGGNKEDA